jgi:hypothetical protein
MKSYFLARRQKQPAKINCPKCKTTVPKVPICSNCGFDMKKYFLAKKGTKAETRETPASSAKAADANAVVPLGKLFSNSLEVFKQRWLPLVILNLLSAILEGTMFAVPFLLGILISPLAGDHRGIVVGVFVLISIALSIIGASWGLAALTAATANNTLSIKEALKAGRKKLLQYAWVLSLAMVAISGGYILFIVPGILFTVWAFPAIFILFTENEHGLKALLKSREYLRGHFVDSFIKLLVLSIAMSIVSAVPFGAFVAYPFAITFMHQMYLNLREAKGGSVSYPGSFAAKFKWVGTGLVGLSLPVAVLGVTVLTVGKNSVPQVMSTIMSEPMAQVAEGPSVTVYQHCDYDGYSAPLHVGAYTLSKLQGKGIINDDLSSIRVPKGLKAIVFEHDNFGGRSWEFIGNDTCFVSRGLNDVASSIRVETGHMPVDPGSGKTSSAKTYLGEYICKASSTIQLKKWNADRTGFAVQEAPEGKVFLLCSFPDTAKSEKAVMYSDADFSLKLEGGQKILRTYGVTTGINAASEIPAFDLSVAAAEYRQMKGAPFSVVFTVPADSSKGTLTVKDVINSIDW